MKDYKDQTEKGVVVVTDDKIFKNIRFYLGWEHRPPNLSDLRALYAYDFLADNDFLMHGTFRTYEKMAFLCADYKYWFKHALKSRKTPARKIQDITHRFNNIVAIMDCDKNYMSLMAIKGMKNFSATAIKIREIMLEEHDLLQKEIMKMLKVFQKQAIEHVIAETKPKKEEEKKTSKIMHDLRIKYARDALSKSEHFNALMETHQEVTVKHTDYKVWFRLSQELSDVYWYSPEYALKIDQIFGYLTKCIDGREAKFKEEIHNEVLNKTATGRKVLEIMNHEFNLKKEETVKKLTDYKYLAMTHVASKETKEIEEKKEKEKRELMKKIFTEENVKNKKRKNLKFYS